MSTVEHDVELPIGFVDSGLGGISVLREAIRLMPSEDFIYYGDSKNAPYGTKEQPVIRELTYAAVEVLQKRGIKGLAVACNTATSAAVRSLRTDFPDLPIVGIEPAIKPAVEHYKGGRILMMATPMTIKQEKYQQLLAKYSEEAEIVSVPCGGLMEFVERGNIDEEELEYYFEENLLPYLTDDTETVVLGCTHYPFLKRYIRDFLANDEISIIDGSYGTSKELKRRLAEKNLLKKEGKKGKVDFMNSSNDKKMLALSNKLLKMPID